MTDLTIEVARGGAILRHVEALAGLRIKVFREWPYLYEGTAEYERQYLESYARSDNSIIVLAKDGGKVVGASTGLPLMESNEAFRNAFANSDYQPESIYYCGESVLLADYRGRGTGHDFFDHREAKAREYGARYAAFCAVEREPHDPRRPSAHWPLDAFWVRRGYKKKPEIRAHLSWREVLHSVESEHELSFWIKAL